jgi:hypothetical protein
MDIDLFNEMGKEFKRLFADKPINKILTIEATANDKSNLKHALETYGKPGMAMEAYAASDKTTGWFVPSVGQLISIVRNLGGDSDFAGAQVSDQTIYTKINEVLKKAGGEIDSNTSTKWWSSNVGTKASSTTGAFLLELSSSGKCEIWVDGYGSKNRVRPILAF